MKVGLQVLCLLVIIAGLLTACDRNDSQNVDLPNYETSIHWGRRYGWTGNSEFLHNAEIVRRISSTFRVSVIPELLYMGLDENNPPCIFDTTLDMHTLLDSGTTRTIPFDMISRYAPRYANLLSSVPFGLDAFKCSDTGNLVGLPVYLASTDIDLFAYSVYRLDWLEEHSIPLPGNITPLVDGRIYFTDTAFTQDQFLEIMRAFSEPPSNYGFAIMRRYDQLPNLRGLKGMWGLGNSIVNDSGRPNYYFADPRYKEFLQFMAYMYGEGLFTSPNQRVELWQYETLRYGIWQRIPTGWFQADLTYLMNPAGVISWLLELQPDAKLLVAPPEVGLSGASGIGARSTSPLSSSYGWVIGVHVSDDELATILTIFDYVSFDHEAYVMVNFGLEGEHFEWEGTPFDSKIIQSREDAIRANESGAAIFSTSMHTPEGMVYRLGNNALTRHSSSDAGRQAVILPYREDIYGEFTQQYAELTERYGEELMRIRERFFLLAIRGQIDIEAEWPSYIDELNENGLQQFLALVEQFPVVGR